MHSKGRNAKRAIARLTSAYPVPARETESYPESRAQNTDISSKNLGVKLIATAWIEQADLPEAQGSRSADQLRLGEMQPCHRLLHRRQMQ